MVGLFAGLCASEGHNRAKTGNKYQTFDGKMAAVAFAHMAVRNAKLDFHDPEFELIAQGYKRTNSSVDRKQSVTTPMLFKMRVLLGSMNQQETLLWGSIILGFFFLDRCSELWDDRRQINRGREGTLHQGTQRDRTRQAWGASEPKGHESSLGGSSRLTMETKSDRVLPFGNTSRTTHFMSSDSRPGLLASA